MNKAEFKHYVQSMKHIYTFMFMESDLDLPDNFNNLRDWRKNYTLKYTPKYYVTSWVTLKLDLENTIRDLHNFNIFTHSVFSTDISNIIHKLKQKLVYLEKYMNHITMYLNKYLNMKTFNPFFCEPCFIVYDLIHFHPLHSSQVPSVIHYLKYQVIQLINTNSLSNNSIIKAKCFIVANAFPNPVSFAKKYHLSVKHVKYLWKNKAQWSTASIKDIKMLNHIYDKIIGNYKSLC